MAEVRKNPLPPGRYWITVISTGKSELDHFRQWAAANPKRVKIERIEPVGAGSANGAFFIFSIVALPTTFDQAQFGFPNEAGPDIQHASDTAQRPPAPTPASVATDFLGDIFGGITKALDAFDPRAKIVLGVGLVYLLTRKKD